MADKLSAYMYSLQYGGRAIDK